MAGRFLASLHTSAPCLLREHAHIARMLSVSAAAASTAQADLPSSPQPASNSAAAPAAGPGATTAVSPPDEQSNAAESVMEMFRLHNTSLPNLQGQVVVGTIVQADKRSVLIDVGYKSLQRFFRSELADAPIYSRDGRSRGVPAELMVGDLLHFTIRDLDTIFGDMLLDVHSLRPAERAERVLQELEQAQETQTPVLGRILNPVARGFSVGLGGIVAFLPMSQCLVRTSRRVGVLQPFLVSEVTRNIGMRGVLQPTVVVLDAEKLREDEAFRRKRYDLAPERRSAVMSTQDSVPADRRFEVLSTEERLRRQRERQEASAQGTGRRAASAYAMLRKSRQSRQQSLQEEATEATLADAQASLTIS